MKVAVIDYSSGNLKSVIGIFKTAAILYSLDCDIFITSNPLDVLSCDRLILPGVGSYLQCYNSLSAIPNMIDAINVAVNKRKVPFLGICVGMHLMSSFGLEDRKVHGFNWIPGLVSRISPSLKVRCPHMGWNIMFPINKHYIFSSIPFERFGYNVYFVHSYVYNVFDMADVLAITNYSVPIVAVISRCNIIGVQFHPEKSHNFGLMFCRNFLSWDPNKS